MGIFGARTANVDSKPLHGRALQVSYRQKPDTFAGFVRGIKRGILVGSSKLAFDIASARPAELMVQLEEIGGGKYNLQVSVEGGSVAHPVQIIYSDMKAADDSKDTNGKLDLDQVKQILFIDLAGPLNQADGENTIWINNLRAVKG